MGQDAEDTSSELTDMESVRYMDSNSNCSSFLSTNSTISVLSHNRELVQRRLSLDTQINGMSANYISVKSSSSNIDENQQRQTQIYRLYEENMDIRRIAMCLEQEMNEDSIDHDEQYVD